MKVIITGGRPFVIQGGSLESYYEQTMDYLHTKYHSYPSNLQNIPVSSEMESEMGYWTSMGQQIADDHASQTTMEADDIPLGKLVV